MKKTLENLTKAYVGECQARNRYTFYAKTAQQEGYEQLAELFLLTAQQEKAHAKRLFKFIQELKENNDEIKIETGVPTVFGTSIDNLKAAIAGETYETDTMYPEFAAIAQEEGLVNIASHLKSIAVAERNHKEKYELYLNNIEKGEVFKKTSENTWVCRECGYTYTGLEAPKSCPSCDHPQAFYEIRNMNF
ncbi:MAG: rubrerythrin family protein [Candidatus Falkowbacteria bacterium]